MSMTLVLAEKPSVAQDLARVLGRPDKRDGYVQVGDDWLITWAYGHLAELAPPERYDPAMARWTWDTLPVLPGRMDLVLRAKAAAQLRLIERLARRPDVSRIVAATDADREGELIWRWIARLAQWPPQKPVLRLWLDETTPAAIRAAFAALKPAATYDTLFAAAEARAQADWIVGLNATRAVTLRHGQPGQGALSVGRVQTPTLRLLADRDAEIEGFAPWPYWLVRATFAVEAGTYMGLWIPDDPADPDHPERVTEAAARALAARLPPGTPGRVRTVERKAVAVAPPLPYSLTDLQKDANRRLGLTAQQTLDAAQALYEAHLASYPRTEARHVTAEILRTVPDRLRGLAGLHGELVALAEANRAAWGRIADDAKVAEAGHYAIIPTGQAPPEDLGERERAVFDLIARRLLASLLPAVRDERVTVWTEAAGARFRTRGTTVLDPGWRRALAPAEEDEDRRDAEPDTAVPPGLREGDAVTVQGVETPRRETQPPARHTDATLLAAMERHGLGTPATRARILEVLLQRGYAERRKKALVSTDKGRALLQVVPDALRSPELTGEWERRLEAVAAGAEDAAAFLADVRAYAAEVVATVRGQATAAVGGDLGPCPACDAGRIVAGRKAWGCLRWREGCRWTLWREVAGKTLTEAQARQLLERGETGVVRGCRSKAGKAFDARLRLDRATGRVTFVFDQDKGGDRHDGGHGEGARRDRPRPAARRAGRPYRGSAPRRPARPR
ncbi:MAG: DNA topoisomerase III [Actinomycetia bacterium]|nr:DNA topoisomerase III [Actinomycetes bacterium]